MNKLSKKAARSFAFYLLHTGFLLGFFESEDGGDMTILNVIDFHRIARRYIPEGRTLRNHRCENLRSSLFMLLRSDLTNNQLYINLQRSDKK
jgi:hypothetical protein